MKLKQEYRVGVGVSAMLLIFVILSIVTLGVLSYLSAKADHALTQKNIDMVQGYYTASADAQRQLLIADSALSAMTGEQEIQAYTRENGMVYGDHTLQFTVDAGGGRVLNVEAQLNERFQIVKITRYTIENNAEWSPALSEFPVF